MPEKPIAVELVDYVRDLFAPEDAALLALTRAAKEFGMPEGWEVSADVGRLFQMLCRAIGAKRVVEFGTLAGHSALWLARSWRKRRRARRSTYGSARRWTCCRTWSMRSERRASRSMRSSWMRTR